jgi:hypothetical protein
MTQILLSSAVTWLDLKGAFRLAKLLDVDGIELFPFKWTTPAKVKTLSAKYNVAIKGIHYPLWWKDKKLSDIINAEDKIAVKLLVNFYNVCIGFASRECRAAELARVFPADYHIVHADVFRRMPAEDKKIMFGNSLVLVENEWPKRGEPKSTYDPYKIKVSLTGNSDLMFDPRHIQIGQARGYLPIEPISEIYKKLRPRGLHFSFIGSKFSSLPSPEVWSALSKEIKRHPPEYIVLELTSGKKYLRKARGMLRKLLGK